MNEIKIREMEERVVALARDLVRIKSQTGSEEEIVSFLKNLYSDWGLTVQTIDKCNIVATLKGTIGTPRLLFCGHHDHVFEGNLDRWIHDPFSGKIEGNSLYGRGAADAKGGLAAVSSALETLCRTEARLKGDVVLAVVREEVMDLNDRGIIKVLNAGLDCDFGVVLEPTNLDIGLGHKGRVTAEFTTRGKAAHSSMPWEGVNAINHMVALVNEVNALQLPNREPLGQGALNVGRIEGGVLPSIVPDSCTLLVDRRITEGETPELVLKEYKKILDKLRRTVPNFEGEIKLVTTFLPSRINLEDRIVQSLSAAAKEADYYESRTRYLDFHTDQEWLVNSAEIPCAILGPGAPEVAHTSNELVPIWQLKKAARIYLNLIKMTLS